MIINYLLFSNDNNNVTSLRLEKDQADGQFYYYASCKLQSYDSLWLRLEDYWFEIQPKTYVLDKHPTVTNLCRIGISQSQTSDVILGLDFLHNFYMIFDTEQDKIGIALHNVTKSRYLAGPPYVN